MLLPRLCATGPPMRGCRPPLLRSTSSSHACTRALHAIPSLWSPPSSQPTSHPPPHGCPCHPPIPHSTFPDLLYPVPPACGSCLHLTPCKPSPQGCLLSTSPPYDARKRLRLSELLMSLLFHLDSAREVRDYMRRVIRRAIVLQVAMDAIAAREESNEGATSPGNDAVGERLGGNAPRETLEAQEPMSTEILRSTESNLEALKDHGGFN